MVTGVGKRTYWPQAPGWLSRRVWGDVDVPDPVIETHYAKPSWTVRWAEADRLREAQGGTTTIELWEIRFQRFGWKREIETLYVVDATAWLMLDSKTSTAFFQTMSFWRSITAVHHYERLVARLPEAVGR